MDDRHEAMAGHVALQASGMRWVCLASAEKGIPVPYSLQHDCAEGVEGAGSQATRHTTKLCFQAVLQLPSSLLAAEQRMSEV